MTFRSRMAIACITGPPTSQRSPDFDRDQGRDCGAAEILRVVENAPRWPDMNLAAMAERSLSISKSLILFQATPARPAWADAGFRRYGWSGRGAADRGSA